MGIGHVAARHSVGLSHERNLPRSLSRETLIVVPWERGVRASDAGLSHASLEIERERPVLPPLGWSYAPKTSLTVGSWGGACPELRMTPVTSLSKK
jgi:hypothetical protein